MKKKFVIDEVENKTLRN